MLAPEGAASGAPEEFPLDTGNCPEFELPLEDNDQGLDQVQASPPEPPVTEGDGAAAAPEAEVDAEVEPVAVQEEGPKINGAPMAAPSEAGADVGGTADGLTIPDDEDGAERSGERSRKVG